MVSSPHVVLLISAIVACSCCPSDDWIPYTNGMCYCMVQIFAPWYTVDNICDYGTPGARAVSIHDLLQNAFLAETVANGTAAWLGLSRLDATSPWRWSDGSQYDFDNWWNGQPLGDCAFINYGKEGEWAAMDCDFSSAWFLCQIDEHHGTVDDAASVRRQMDQ